MKLTKGQRRIVEENLGLVGKVVKDRVRNLNTLGLYTYDDLFQIGCIGLSKAAATDKGGHFSTYAYRLIWNEICDALVYAIRRMTREKPTEDFALLSNKASDFDSAISLDIRGILKTAKENANASTRKGIAAIEMQVQGYSCKEIGESLHAPENHVTAWMSKARKYLRGLPELQALQRL